MSKLKQSMSKLSFVNTVLLISILIFLFIQSSLKIEDNKRAYINTAVLFQEFDYQKELSSEFEKQKSEKELLLSKQFEAIKSYELAATGDLSSDDQYKYMVLNYQQNEKIIQEEIQQMSSEFSQNVWNKLNSYINLYGESNDYDIIFGANGSGNILYAQEHGDITQELIVYCNNKYSGK